MIGIKSPRLRLGSRASSARIGVDDVCVDALSACYLEEAERCQGPPEMALINSSYRRRLAISLVPDIRAGLLSSGYLGDGQDESTIDDFVLSCCEDALAGQSTIVDVVAFLEAELLCYTTGSMIRQSPQCSAIEGMRNFYDSDED